MKLRYGLLAAAMFASAPAHAATYIASVAAQLIVPSPPFGTPAPTPVDSVVNQSSTAAEAARTFTYPFSGGSGGGTASAGQGYLKVGLNNTVTSSFVSTALVIARAEWRDTLTAVGAPDLAFVEFVYHLDGTMTGSGNTLSLNGYTFRNQNVDQDVSVLLQVLDGKINYNLFLAAGSELHSSGSGSMDFMHTMTLKNAIGRTSSGSETQLSSLVGVGGSSYLAAATSGVPEPATWAMMIVGFGMIGGAMRRKQRQTVRYRFA